LWCRDAQQFRQHLNAGEKSATELKSGDPRFAPLTSIISKYLG
jgi:hypothetical protein